jgi:hypothetical protein
MIRFLIGFWLIVMAIGVAMSVMMACDDEDVKGAIVFLVTLALTSAAAEFGFWMIATSIGRVR